MLCCVVVVALRLEKQARDQKVAGLSSQAEWENGMSNARLSFDSYHWGACEHSMNCAVFVSSGGVHWLPVG